MLPLTLIPAGLLSLVACALIFHAAGRRRRLDWQHSLLGDIGAADWRRLPFGNVRLGRMSVSPAWRRIAGGAAAGRRGQVDGWLDEVAHPLDREQAGAALQAQLLPDGPAEQRQTLRLRSPGSGEWRWHELRSVVQQRDRRGRALRLLSTLADASGQHTAAERERISAGLFQHLQEGVLVTDLQLRVLDANPAWCRIAGQPREHLLGRRAAPDDALLRAGHDPAAVLRTLDAGQDWHGHVSLQRADGSLCTLALSITTIPEPGGPLRFRVVTATDETELLSQRRLLQRQSRYDALTGLPSQGEFMRQLRGTLEAGGTSGPRFAVCRIDLDHFSRINAEHGTAIADALLARVAQRLARALRNGPRWADSIARLDGDEFALRLRIADSEEAQRALERLMGVLRAPYRLDTGDGRELLLELGASIGATLYPHDDADAETLLRHAGHALYRIKRAGRNGVRFFDAAKRQRDEASLIALARVQQALDHHELQLHYQPKIDMQSGRVLGMEALLRWQHPERGLLGPAEFLLATEGTGLAVQIGDWVIEQALRQISLWLEQGLALQVSVNVTARQLQAPDFAQRLQELIQRHQRPLARYLSLEVLESAALADVEATQQLIQRCREFGVRFALDDFGTGYSTLTYLKKLPVDALKIDRSFVQHMLTDAQDMALVEGVIGLARHFGAEVIAEGVESAAHARALLRLGCQQGQGNGISPALPAEEVPGWVQAFARLPWLTRQPDPVREPIGEAVREPNKLVG